MYRNNIKFLINWILLPTQLCSFLLLSICCNSENPILSNAVIGKEIIGTWKIANLKVNSIKRQKVITIDTFFNNTTFNELIIIEKDSIRFYVADTIYTPALEYKTVFSFHSYSLFFDSLTIFTEFVNMKARITCLQNTITLFFKIDAQNPYSQKYGIGEMKRNYVRYTGPVLPATWPPLF
jgi:hypothetical protein